MILTLQGIPCHLLLLKGTQQATDEETKSSSSKWLGFAKGYAIKCLNLSRQTHGWVTKTTKLPSKSETGDDDEKFQFLMVKCNADAKYCLIVIRAVGGESGHGIYITPASELSPIGFGSPYSVDSVPINNGWGKSGVTAASRILMSELPAESDIGGEGFQCLIVPASPSTKYLYGEKRNAKILPGQTVLGGAVAVTGKLSAADYGANGRPKSDAKFDVYSVANNHLGPLNTWHINYRIRQIDRTLQAEGIQAFDAGDTSVLVTHPWHYGLNESSVIYKNGEELEYTVVANGGAGIVYDGYTYYPLRFAVGVSIREVEDGETTVRRMTALFTAGRVQFEGTIFYHHYMLGWADPPYDAFECEQLIDLSYPHFQSADSYNNNKFPYHDRINFFSNESGTRMSGMAAGYSSDFDTTVGGTPVLTQVVHLDIASDGKSCAVVKEPRSVIPPPLTDGVRDPGGNPPAAFSTTSSTVTDPITVAIAYDGDIEKRLTVTYDRTSASSRVKSGEWTYVESLVDMVNTTFRLGDTELSGYAQEYFSTYFPGDGTDPVPHSEYDADIPLLLGIDPTHDVIYCERLLSDETYDGYQGETGFAATTTHGYSLVANDDILWSGSGTLVYPDAPAVEDTSKSIGVGVKFGVNGYQRSPQNVIWDAYAAITPVRGSGEGGQYAGSYFQRAWFAADAYGNTLFTCYVPRVILPGDPESSGGINFSYRGFPNEWGGAMHMDQFPDGIQIARYTKSNGDVVNLSDVFDVPGAHIGWKFAGVF